MFGTGIIARAARTRNLPSRPPQPEQYPSRRSPGGLVHQVSKDLSKRHLPTRLTLPAASPASTSYSISLNDISLSQR